MTKLGRNAPCPCGSGKKYKKCCLGRSDGIQPSRAAKMRYIPVYTKLDRLSNSVIDLIKENKFDKADAVCRQLLSEYPDQIDGLHRQAQVYEARGDKSKAAEYYCKSVDFAKSMPGFDKQSVDGFLAQAKRMGGKNLARKKSIITRFKDKIISLFFRGSISKNTQLF